jgi:hypothetical protein
MAGFLAFPTLVSIAKSLALLSLKILKMLL